MDAFDPLTGRPTGLPPALDPRSAAVLREIVEQYVETGEPVGSRTLSRRLPLTLSPATIRNVMADLTEAGLLFAPHTSAGRLPTERGLRLFVDGLLQFGELSEDERDDDRRARSRPRAAACRTRWPRRRAHAVGAAAAAGLVLAPKSEGPLRHIEFVPLGPGRALVILVGADGQVENRVIDTAARRAARSALQQAGNYLNAQPDRAGAGRAAPDRGRGDRRRPHRSWTRCRSRWWRRGWPPGPARAAAAA